jgi:hypothetical protein
MTDEATACYTVFFSHYCVLNLTSTLHTLEQLAVLPAAASVQLLACCI